jgi:predicted kinase
MAALAAGRDVSLEAVIGIRGLDASGIHALADVLSAQHAASPPATLAAFKARLAAAVAIEAQRRALDDDDQQFQRRDKARRIRLIDGAPADILFDLAAPLAELVALGRSNDANLLANRYLDVRPQGAIGWALLPLYLSLRIDDPALAEAVLAPSPARLVAVGGLSGSGKSSLSRLIGARLGRTPGARVLRSDVFRKRLAGLAPESRLPPSHYTRRSDQETYEALFESADDHLACGNSVILDAVFMSRSERDVVEAIAHRARVPFTGIWLDAPERDRVARVTERFGDASDAGADVVREQSRRSVGELATWHRIRTNRSPETIVAAARKALERKQR